MNLRWGEVAGLMDDALDLYTRRTAGTGRILAALTDDEEDDER